MNIDVHAHHVPVDSLKMASESGARHGLTLEKDARGREVVQLDTITHSPMALEYLIENFGAELVLLGSDFPYDMGEPEPLASLGAARISAEQRNQVAGANGCKLLQIDI